MTRIIKHTTTVRINVTTLRRVTTTVTSRRNVTTNINARRINRITTAVT
jgi:hypothetical protein